MMLATRVSALSLWLFIAQAAPSGTVKQGIADFNRGDYKNAGQILRQFPSDPNARAYLALTQAATGGCEAAIPELTRQFAAKGFRESAPPHRSRADPMPDRRKTIRKRRTGGRATGKRVSG